MWRCGDLCCFETFENGPVSSDVFSEAVGFMASLCHWILLFLSAFQGEDREELLCLGSDRSKQDQIVSVSCFLIFNLLNSKPRKPGVFVFNFGVFSDFAFRRLLKKSRCKLEK